MSMGARLALAYRLRWKRRRLLWRALQSRRQLQVGMDRTGAIRQGQIIAFSTMRNEQARLPFFLDHYRRLGVSHFIIVDNGSTDRTADILAAEPDVSVWKTSFSYKSSRFGVDWLTWLQMRYGHGHWCLTADADEILVFPGMETRNLTALTAWLENRGVEAFGAMMLDLYPKEHLSAVRYQPGDDPTKALGWFDGAGYHWEKRSRYQLISIRGGARERAFFANNPEHSPHLHKIPLIKWNRRFAYVSSTHMALPSGLNRVFDPGLRLPTGVLLHSKFLDIVIEKSREEITRKEHFTHAERYDDYYQNVIADPVLWNEHSVAFENTDQLVDLGLMTRGDWKEE